MPRARRRSLPTTITPAEFERLMATTAGDSLTARRNAAMLAAMYWQGLRVSELTGETPAEFEHRRGQWRKRVAEWEARPVDGRSKEPPVEPVPGPVGLSPRDLDLAARELRVRNGKGGKDRDLPIRADALGHLEAWAEVRPESRYFFCTVSEGARHRAGEQLSTRYVHAMVRRLAAKAEVTKRTEDNGEAPINPHVLRHSCATDLVDRIGVHRLQRFLGHESLATTEVYLHVRPAELRDAVDRADGGEPAPPPAAVEDRLARLERALAATGGGE